MHSLGIMGIFKHTVCPCGNEGWTGLPEDIAEDCQDYKNLRIYQQVLKLNHKLQTSNACTTIKPHLTNSGIKNKERPLGEDKWARHRKSRGEWEGHCGHLFTWVGASFLRECTSLERAWGRGYACTCSQCNQRRTRVRAEALKQSWPC